MKDCKTLLPGSMRYTSPSKDMRMSSGVGVDRSRLSRTLSFGCMMSIVCTDQRVGFPTATSRKCVLTSEKMNGIFGSSLVARRRISLRSSTGSSRKGQRGESGEGASYGGKAGGAAWKQALRHRSMYVCPSSRFLSRWASDSFALIQGAGQFRLSSESTFKLTVPQGSQ